ncbi:MAG: DUF2288 family protein [Neisseria sp.]|nr:DUF2288 family protein [Neisseria sp.]
MSEPLLYQKLNLETARIAWHELQPHFARGAVVAVTADADLPQVAEWMAQDNAAQIARLLADKTLFTPDADTARRWYAENCEMWAVVVAPWVVVQEQ